MRTGPQSLSNLTNDSQEYGAYLEVQIHSSYGRSILKELTPLITGLCVWVLVKGDFQVRVKIK